MPFDATLKHLIEQFPLDWLHLLYVLLGLRYSREFVKTLFQEVREMKESTTYQAILEEGELIATRITFSGLAASGSDLHCLQFDLR